jgi:virulence factor Mce-like protein
MARGAAEPTRIPRKDRRGASPVKVAAIVLLLAAIGIFLGFTKDIPFTKGYRVSAVFESANSIRAGSPVRIAGVTVGKVKSIGRYQDTDLAVVEMEITDEGLPLHKDATARIRPRIFLEGNFFVDMTPGSPGQPQLGDGDVLRATQTSSPVQLDEVLTALQSDSREDLQELIEEYGKALQGDPAASDRGQDPEVVGETAAESLNDTFDDAAPALRGAAVVNEALLGEQPRDMSRLIAGLTKVTAALGRNERSLQDLVTNLNRTMAIFGDERANVSATLRQLGATLPEADRTFALLNRAFPSTRAFAREIIPGVRATPGTIEATFPWIDQARPLLSRAELGGVARELRQSARGLAVVTDSATRFFPKQRLLARCLTDVILPTGDIKIQDGPFSTGSENYKSFWYGMVGLAGEGQNFDANGQYVRFQTGGGSPTFTTESSNIGSAPQFFRTSAPPLGTRPARVAQKPPYRPQADCYRQPLPNLNAAPTGPADGAGGRTLP